MSLGLLSKELIPQTMDKGIIIFLGLVILRDSIWKSIALWRAGNQKKLARFICIFILNTAGLLPIIYLTFFNKKKKKK